MDMYADPDAIEQLVAADMADELKRREEIEALVTAIGSVSDPLVRRILLKIVEIIE